MAHFARLDENNIVETVIVVSNDDLLDDDGNEQESLGVAICEQIVGPGVWVQTSYNGTFRKQYGEPGFSYDATADVFIAPQPFPSWTLDANYDWQPPTPEPEQQPGTVYLWDEDTLAWVQYQPE